MKPMSKKGILIVVSGPSGGGKGTVVRRMREMLPEIGFSVSATTRPPRTGEVDGEDYYFITREKFTAMIGGGEMLEHTEYCGNFYGTPRAEVERVAKDLNISTLFLEVNEQNKPAIHLYEKLGFEKLGVRKKYYNNNNGIIMKKNLK